VTKRANSVLPLSAPADTAAALAEVERRSAARWQQAVFQISPAAQPEGLDEYLAERGYELASPTLVQVMDGTELDRFRELAGTDGPAVDLAAEPDEDWLRLYWADNGTADPSDQEVSRQILKGSAAVYASIRDGAGTAAIARMALVAGNGGIACLVTRPDARRLGYARRVSEALLAGAADRGLAKVWLQVEETNTGAIVLYNSLGFDTFSKYHYRSKSV
jgi:ribosomal protein S18 acetylase RimI-like enzyme